MNNLLLAAIAVLIGSGAAVIWGLQYRGDHPLAAVGAFFGSPDETYAVAGWAAGLGALAFLIGIALLIAGLMEASRAKPK